MSPLPDSFGTVNLDVCATCARPVLPEDVCIHVRLDDSNVTERTYVAVDALVTDHALERAGNVFMWAATTGAHPDASAEGAAHQIIDMAVSVATSRKEATT